MKSKAFLIGIVALVFGLAAYVSHIEKAEVIRFNDQVVERVIQSDGRFPAVLDAFELYFNEEGASTLVSLTKRVEVLRTEVEGDIDEYKAMQLKGGPRGEAFHEAGSAYLSVSKAYVSGFEQFLNYAAGNPERIEGQRVFWGQLMGVLEQRSDEAMKTYLDRQKAFADLHGFTIHKD